MSSTAFPNAPTVATIDRILELAPARLLEVDGFTLVDKDKTATLFTPPARKTLKVGTLTGFTDLLEAGFEDYVAPSMLVHVAEHDQVSFLAKNSDSWGRREEMIRAVAQKPEREFTFNTYQPQEQFVIALRSLFIQDSRLDDLVRLAGNLAAQTEMRQKDDGFTQTATVKTGVVMVEEKTILPRVTLTPFRTFREVVQPSSDYVFRVKGSANGNTCALFEADGGTWKLQAIANVKEWLGNQLKGSEVAGLGEMPVIA